MVALLTLRVGSINVSKKTLEQEISELIAKIQPQWGEVIVREAKAIEPIVVKSQVTKRKPKSKTEPLTVFPKESVDGMRLIRFNRGGKTAVVVLEDKVQVIFKFPTSSELNGFIKWFE